MKAGVWGTAISVVAGALVACGDNTGGVNGDRSTGVRVSLSGDTATHLATTPMATIVVQNVFDSAESYLIECMKKDHQLDGKDFCDELIVVPPGVYEIVVQSHEGCSSPQDHYKVIVKQHETVELRVDLVCGAANGGLDVIVTENFTPVIIDIDFSFLHGGIANKFVCQYGQPVVVTVTASDHDTACDHLTGDWYVQDGDHWVHVDPAGPLPPPFAAITPHGCGCVYTATINPNAPLGDYLIKLKVSDGSLFTWLSFPIHIIDCGLVDP